MGICHSKGKTAAKPKTKPKAKSKSGKPEKPKTGTPAKPKKTTPKGHPSAKPKAKATPKPKPDPPQQVANATALIIAVNYDNYDTLYDDGGAEMINVKSNVDNASWFADTCTQCGLNVVTLMDGWMNDGTNSPTKENILAKISEISGTMGEDSMLIIYFAGLGFKVDDGSGSGLEIEGEGMCLPGDDGSLFDPEYYLTDAEFEEALASVSCPTVVLVDTDYGSDILNIQDSEALAEHQVVLFHAGEDYPLAAKLISVTSEQLDYEKEAAYSLSDVWKGLVKAAQEDGVTDFLTSQQSKGLSEAGIKMTAIPWPVSTTFPITNPASPPEEEEWPEEEWPEEEY